MNCDDCELPESGEKSYDCPRLNCRMIPHDCELYRTRPNYRRAWDDGRGPGQVFPPVKQTARPKPVPAGGPGTELKKLLATMRVRSSGCKCNHRAAEMDRRGAAWCREHLDQITSWLLGEARRRNYPLANLSRPAVKVLIRWAIQRSKRRQS